MRSLRSCSRHGAGHGRSAGFRILRPLLGVTFVGMSVCWSAAAPAESYRPVDPHEVLLEIPPRKDLAALRAAADAYREAPADPGRRSRLIDAELSAGRRYADPRYFGEAEALLVRWRESGSGQLPIALELDWADILQHRHDYAAARLTLNSGLQRDPGNAQAHLMRAQLGLAQGRLAEARADCASLVREGPVGLACLAQVLGMNGDLTRATALMDRALAMSVGDAATQSWMLTARADMAVRAGDSRSLGWLERAVDVDPDDQYARLALVDAHLDAGRLDLAQRILQAGARSDAALLRAAIIDSRRAAHCGDCSELAARHAEAEARGERVHLRDLARFRLEALHDAPSALAAAQENFQAQREPWDARVLLEAAHATGDRGAVRDVLDWRRATGYQDQSLTALFAWAEGAR